MTTDQIIAEAANSFVASTPAVLIMSTASIVFSYVAWKRLHAPLHARDNHGPTQHQTRDSSS